MPKKSWKNQKYLTPEKVWEYFCDYKTRVKNEHILVHDFVGKDADEVFRKREKPLTIEWVLNFIYEREGTDIEHYFFPAESQKEAYKDYLGVCSRIRRIVKEDQIIWGMAGIYNPSITQRLNGLTEKQEIREVDKEGNDKEKHINITINWGKNKEGIIE